MTALLIIGFAILLFIFFYNSLIAKKTQVDNILASVDAELKKRYDLIPNLVATARQYMEHEKALLEKITQLRTRATQRGLSQEEKAKIDKEVSDSLGSLMVAVENYPELKSNENIIQLQQTITDVEANIAAARRAYNQAVTDYNSALEMIPTNIIANFMKLRPKAFFEIEKSQRGNHDLSKLFAGNS